jgi:hypothetical protein
MNSSPSIVEISKALVKAQSKMGAAVKGASNPYFKSKYSDLNSVIEACKNELNSEGITVLQPVISEEGGDYVETILLHTSGEFISSKMKLRTQKENDMQAYGSSISYARRYGLQAMVLIPSSDDDDGEAAVGRTKKTEKPTLTLAPAPQASTADMSLVGTQFTNSTEAPKSKTTFRTRTQNTPNVNIAPPLAKSSDTHNLPKVATTGSNNIF